MLENQRFSAFFAPAQKRFPHETKEKFRAAPVSRIQRFCGIVMTPRKSGIKSYALLWRRRQPRDHTTVNASLAHISFGQIA
jgi:hypothetical protein